MAIVFRHDAASLAGALGGGDNRRRGRKYAMDRLAQQGQQRQAQPVLQQPEGQWVDPLAGEAVGFLDDEEQRKLRVQQRAQGKAAQRKYKLGEQYQGNLLPRFQPQSEIDAIQKREDEARKIAREDDVFEREIAARKEAAALSQGGIDRRAAASSKESRYAEVLDDLESGDRVLDPVVEKRIEDRYKEVVTGLEGLDEDGKAEAMEKFNNWKRDQQMFGARRPKKDERPRNDRLKDYLGDSYEKYKHLPWVPDDKGGFELPSNLPTEKEKKPEGMSQKDIQDDLVKRYRSKIGKEKDGEAYTPEQAYNEAIQEQMDEFKLFPQQGSSGAAATAEGAAPSPAAPPVVDIAPDGTASPVTPAAVDDFAAGLGLPPPRGIAPAPPAAAPPPAPTAAPSAPPFYPDDYRGGGSQNLTEPQPVQRVPPDPYNAVPVMQRAASSPATATAPPVAPGESAIPPRSQRKFGVNSAPPARARGSRNFGQPIQNYQPANDAERNLMAKGYARVPLLNSQGKQTGKYSWAPPGAQSPDMLANRQAPVNAPTPPPGAPQEPINLVPGAQAIGGAANSLLGNAANAFTGWMGSTPPQSPPPVMPPTPQTAAGAQPVASPQAQAATRQPPHAQYGIAPDAPPEVVSEVQWLDQLFATKGGPANWTPEERARYQQNREKLARYNTSNQ